MRLTKDTYIISDTHFAHEGVNKFSPERKELIEQGRNPDKIILRNWEAISGEILHLGDFCFKDSTNIAKKIGDFKSMNFLLPGNHDTKADLTYLFGFKKIIKGVQVDLNGRNYILDEFIGPFGNAIIKDFEGVRVFISHFPLFDNCEHDQKKDFAKSIKALEELYEDFNCDINIHGHTHGRNSNFKKCIIVCVEKTDFKQFKFSEILEKYA